MYTEPTTHTYPELAGELSTWLVGGGILTTALFPLALPIIVLTAAAAIPLVVVGLVVGVAAAPIVLLRRLGRSFRASRRSRYGTATAGVSS
jgi:hypothetical protein